MLIIVKRCQKYHYLLMSGVVIEKKHLVSSRTGTTVQHCSTIVLQLELTLLSFVRLIRDSNFELYVGILLHNLALWFFCLDQTHYARWLSVHLRDMVSLKHRHPDIAAEFRHGKFTVAKSRKYFSAISIDEAPEQLNAQIKGDSGAIGLTETDAALVRWVIAGPARSVQNFE